MKAALYLSAAVMVAVCATWAYRVNYATQEALNRVADLRAAVAQEREALSVLNAEWAYLNRPERLAALVAGPGASLGLMPLTPEQFGDAAMVAFPPEPVPIDAGAAVGEDHAPAGEAPAPAEEDHAPAGEAE